jgi:16S rRNA G1207 methylase RsmC
VNIQKETQFFPTPEKLADRLVEYAEIEIGHSILEPSAGQGAIVKAIVKAHPNHNVDCFELSEINKNVLESLPYAFIIGRDFIKNDPVGPYDRIIANPPFSKNQDIDHIRKMYECLKPGGRIVTIASNHWRYSNNKKETAFREWLEELSVIPEDVPAGEFSESGTKIATCILIIDKPL